MPDHDRPLDLSATFRVEFPEDGGLVVSLPQPRERGGFQLGGTGLTIDLPGGDPISVGGDNPFSVTFPSDRPLQVDFPAGSSGERGPFDLDASTSRGGLTIDFPKGGTVTIPTKKPARGSIKLSAAGAGARLVSSRTVTQ